MKEEGCGQEAFCSYCRCVRSQPGLDGEREGCDITVLNSFLLVA